MQPGLRTKRSSREDGLIANLPVATSTIVLRCSVSDVVCRLHEQHSLHARVPALHNNATNQPLHLLQGQRATPGSARLSRLTLLPRQAVASGQGTAHLPQRRGVQISNVSDRHSAPAAAVDGTVRCPSTEAAV
jgi:hypothetical protein